MSTKIFKAIMLCFFIFSVQFISGQIVTINKQYNSDTVLSLSKIFTGKCSSAELNGSIVLHSDTSMVRIMLTDSYGNKWMIAEAYPLICSDSVVTLVNACEETKFLAYKSVPVNLEFYITDATCSISTMIFSNQLYTDYQVRAKDHKLKTENAKLTIMNANLEDRDLLWRAALSEQVLINYSARASLEGSYKGNINGYWYYGGGYYCDYAGYDDFVNNTRIYRSNNTLPNVQTRSFDWRTAHGADLPSSPYFDGNPDSLVVWTSGGTLDTLYEYGNGWMTSVKNQVGGGNCPNGCYLFAVPNALEAVINLYFNQHLDYNLSEQHLADCAYDYDSDIGNCYTGGFPGMLANFINTGYLFVDENTHPWLDSMIYSCDNLTPVECIISGTNVQEINTDENTTKRAIMEKGPLSAHPVDGHICGLVGFRMIQAGDTLRLNRGWGMPGNSSISDRLIVPSGHSLIGRTAWIFKEHGDLRFADRGYYMIIGQPGNLPTTSSSFSYSGLFTDSLNLSLQPQYHDYDGDGYYFWGIGPKPAACPGPELEDCDDNDAFRLYYDENMFCTYDCDSIQQLVSDDPLYISSDTTIYGCLLTRPVVVADNVLLRLMGEFQCTENVYILANIGANIYVSGASFSSVCGERWGGIVGFSNLDPALYGGIVKRSMVTVKNSFIEDADYGIAGDAGTILRVTNTTFQNNTRDVVIEPWYLSSFYSQVGINNGSWFINCNFITGAYAHNDSCAENVSLSYCKGVIFRNCSFVDEGVSGQSFYPENRTAINAYKAGFICEKSYFENLGSGIRCSNSLYLPVDINENEFYETHYNVYLSQTHGAGVIANKILFSAYTCDETEAEILPYGIYLDQCHDYHVEADTIKMGHSSVFFIHSYSDYISGIVVNDSYNSNEQIYRNQVVGMAVGTQAVGLNRDDDEEYGLKILCNDYSRNITDIFVTNNLTNPYPPGSPIGIAQVQGSMAEPAGNFFTKAADFSNLPPSKAVPVWSNIINDVQSFNVNYYHHDPATNSRVYPDSVYNVVRIPSDEIYNLNSSCPDRTETNGGDTIVMLPELRALSTRIEEVSETLETLTDGGNTTLTVAEIVMANDNNAWQTYLSLMDKSPYLSDESLKEVAKKEDGLTAPMVRDILVANPQAAKNAEISGLLDERIDELPAYMIEQIAAGLTEISPKEYLELQKSHLTKEYARQSSALLRQYLRETDTYTATDIETLLNVNPDYISSIKLAEYYASQSNYSGATGVLNSINTTNSMLQNEIDNLSGLFELMQTIESDTLTIDAEKLSELRYYESESGIAGAYARGLLNYSGQIDYQEPIFLPEIMMLRKSNMSKVSETENSYLKVYPNPAKDFVSIEYKLTDEIVNPVIKIVSIHGQIIKYQKIVNKQDIIIFEIKDLTQGNYFVYLENNGKKIESVVITVTK